LAASARSTRADLNLLMTVVPMIWLFPVTILIIGAGALIRARLRANNSRSLTTEPVSGQWLAEARSREEQPW
jgi:cytochrome c-type biogenesis protein CcmH/NrfF